MLGYSRITILYEIRLAMDAISVPRPPKLQPMIRLCHCDVNPERSRAAGTLLMIWLVITETIYTRPFKTEKRKFLTGSILAKFPTKMKNAKKVPSRA